MGIGRAWSAAINYTSATYCSPYTSYTVTEQTTAYNQQTSSSIALGNCSVNMNMFDQSHYAAIEPGDWQNGAGCGACAVLSYNSHATTVMIVDQCATCGNGSHHLDLSAVAYGELVNSPGCAVNGGGGSVNTGGCPSAPGANQVTWHFIQCPLSGSANISYNNASGNITYAFKDGSSNGWHPIIFWDYLFPIQSVGIANGSGGPFTNVPRDTNDSIPTFWGGSAGGNLTPPLYYKITDDRNNSVTLGPIGSVSPLLAANNASFVAYGTSSVQLPGCVVGPTNTFTNTPTKTNTPTVGSPTNTPTFSPTVTSTFTNTPLAGCKYSYYDGETAGTKMSSGSTWVGNATIAENATAAHSGTLGMQFSYNWPAASYYAEVGWNWANYSAASPRIVNLNNFTTLQFDLDVAAGTPVTLGVILADYGGGGSGGVTQSVAVTVTVAATGWQTINIPTSSFAMGGASWDKTKVGEIDLEVFAPATAGTATVYFDNFGFYGTCPTATPTQTNTYTNTASATPTKTNTQTNSFTVTSTPSATATATPSATRTNTQANTSTFTPTSTATATNSPTLTKTNTPTNSFTLTGTPTATGTSTPSATRTNSPTNTATQTPSNTPANTNTFTPTSTATYTKTPTPTNTMTNSPTITNTPTVTATHTNTNLITPTPTGTPTKTFTLTFTSTSTNSYTLTPTPTLTFTPTITPTFTNTNVITSTATGTPTKTSTPTSTASSTNTSTLSPTPTFSWTSTLSPTRTYTPTFTITNTPTVTFTNTNTDVITPTSTGTPTKTFTPTSTATYTFTFTATPTFTFTPTITATFTNTNVITSTPTNTGTFTFTPTFTNTNGPTATFTATSTSTPLPVFQLTQNASGGTVNPGQTLTYTLTLVISSSTANQVTITDNLPSSTTFQNFVSGPAGTLSGGQVVWNLGTLSPATYTFSFNVQVSNSAADGAILSNSAVADFQGESSSTNANGFNVTVVHLTSTPTFTPTWTGTPTPSFTSTPGLQPTICPAYPNPVTNNDFVSMCVWVPGASDVEMTVYTTAFRKIYDKKIQVVDSTILTWDLRDQWGTPIANGLYYVRIRVTGPASTTKFSKVLVNR